MSIDELSFDDIYAKHKVDLNESYDNIVIIDGIPIIGEDKLAKLLKVLKKSINSKSSIDLEDDQLFMPFIDNQSQGYIFVTLKSNDEANALIKKLDNVPFDSKHTFFVNKFTDVESYVNMSDNYVEPSISDYKPKEHLRSWLGDSQGRDQFLTFKGDQVQLSYHNRSNNPPEVVQTKNNWTNSYITISPQGTYIATLHKQGVMLHGGPSLNVICRFPHPNVKLVDFSPQENYFVTWSNEPIVLPQPGASVSCPFTEDDEGNSLAVWNISTGQLLRTFPTTPGKMPWPHLKWSGDERFIGRLVPGQQISIYSVPDMNLVDKKSIKIAGVVDFEWCPWGEKDFDSVNNSNNNKGGPKENMLAYWTPEVENQPARVTLMSFPSRTVLRSKNLFNVSHAKLNWQNNGDFLCVQVHRHTKTKKSMFCNLEIFRTREKDFPVEVVELKDLVTFFAWEPKGERFIIVTQPDTSNSTIGTAAGVAPKTSVGFYQLDRTKGDFKQLKQLDNKQINTIFWSPRGRYVILSTIGASNKFDIEFWDVDHAIDEKKDDKDIGAGIQQIATAEHYGVTDIEWDPSGRYVAAYASVWRHQMENGYTIWDMKGQELQKVTVEKFKQFLWRPRPRTLLPKDEQKKIRKNLREYSRIFDDEDAAQESSVSAELLAHRKRLVSAYNEWRSRCRQSLAQIQAQNSSNDDNDDTTVEEWVDEIIEESEEVLP